MLPGRPDQDLLVLHGDHDVGGLSRTGSPRNGIPNNFDRPEETQTPNVTDDVSMSSLQNGNFYFLIN